MLVLRKGGGLIREAVVSNGSTHASIEIRGRRGAAVSKITIEVVSIRYLSKRRSASSFYRA